jgi:predicted acetyltransferase
MELRKIRPEEMVSAELLRSMAYLNAETEDYKKRLTDPLEHSGGYENVWAVFEGGKMCSVTGVLDFRVRFEGHNVPMGGISGIATLAESRGRGHVRRTFEAILSAMREEGKVFSFLIPFSFDFYRKFGYELCYTPNRAVIPMYLFNDYPMPERVEQVFPGSDVAGLLEIYNTFIREKNLPLVRDAEAMRKRAGHDPYTSRHYVYLHKDAYMLCNAKDGEDGRILNVREMAWVSPEGLRAMFGLIGGLSPEFESLQWDAPDGIVLPALFGDGTEVQISRPAYGMNRIINVRGALQLMKAPKQPGRVKLRVTDDTLPANSGTYTVEWENGKVTLVNPESGAADLETDIQTLTQLVTGFLTPDEARLKRGVTVHGNDKALKELFVRRNLYIAEYF